MLQKIPKIYLYNPSTVILRNKLLELHDHANECNTKPAKCQNYLPTHTASHPRKPESSEISM